jgi:uncharacterized membrane protein YhaH (DUF805 family)
MKWYIEVLKKYAVFSGRAHRTEYWMFCLFNIIIAFVLGVAEGIVGGPGIVGLIYSLAVLLPSIAVTIRRLHDIDRSGWWLLIVLVPLIGPFVLLWFMVKGSSDGDNTYGVNPSLVVV